MPDIDNLDTHSLLLDICVSFDLDPSSSIKSEKYFRDLLSSIPEEADEQSIRTTVKEQIAKDFVAIGKRPEWIQGPEWPFYENKPMVFAGQIDISTEDSEAASQWFHDDTSIYVFLATKAPPTIVVQQY